MNPFINKQCEYYSGVENRMSTQEIKNSLIHTPNWRHDTQSEELVARFRFSNFHQTMQFVNALAEIAHQQDHHPQLIVSYKECEVRYNTHTVQGITENEFICASLIDAINIT